MKIGFGFDKYPEEYNGCFAACPDPIDFSAYCLTNIYEDKNAYYYESENKNFCHIFSSQTPYQ